MGLRCLSKLVPIRNLSFMMDLYNSCVTDGQKIIVHNFVYNDDKEKFIFFIVCHLLKLLPIAANWWQSPPALEQHARSDFTHFSFNDGLVIEGNKFSYWTYSSEWQNPKGMLKYTIKRNRIQITTAIITFDKVEQVIKYNNKKYKNICLRRLA